MATFVMMFRAGSVDPADYESHSKAWMAWFDQLAATGKLKEGGAPLSQTGRVVRAGGEVKDYDYRADSNVNGISFFEADSIEEVVALTEGCPAIDPNVGGIVEVRELSSM